VGLPRGFVPCLDGDAGPGGARGRVPTDHHGNPYTAIDPVAEIKKYQAGRQEVLYHNPILIAAPRDHEKMLRILERFNSFLDAKQLVGFRHARETN